jgi:hypothetical protein
MMRKVHHQPMHLSPAKYVVLLFGSISATARALGRDRTAVSKWLIDTDHRGTGGKIPQPLHEAVLFTARQMGFDLTPQDLIYGREMSEREIASLIGEEAESEPQPLAPEVEPVRFHFGAKS